MSCTYKKIPNSKQTMFNAEIKNTDWSEDIYLSNPNHILTNFYNKLETTRQKYTSTCKIPIRQNKIP